MAELTYRFIVYPAGNSTTSTGSEDFTITQAYLADGYEPVILGQNIDILRGTTESRPWQIDVVDYNNFLASKLNNKLIGRLIRAQRKKDAGSWTTLGTARITNIAMGPSEGSITCQDERWLERQTDVWTDCDRDDDWPSTGAQKKAGTLLVPPQIDGNYGLFSYEREPFTSVLQKSGNLARVLCDEFPGISWSGDRLVRKNIDIISARTVDFMRDDLKDSGTDWTTSASTGNFRTLRCRVNGVEYPVHTVTNSGWLLARYAHSLDEQLDILEEIESRIASGGINVWVVSTGLSAGQTLTEAVLLAPEHEPTEHVPLHIGGYLGMHGMTLARKLYTEKGIRYSTAIFDTLEAESQYDGLRFRITSKEKLADFLDKKVYQPLGLVPFVNTNGELAPVSIFMPQNVAPGGLPSFTSTNLSDPHPDWSQQGRDIVTRLTLEYTTETQVKLADEIRSAPADGLRIDSKPITYNSTEFGGSTGRGIHETKLDFSGYHRENNFTVLGGTFAIGARTAGKVLAAELFDRYQYGPIRGSLTSLSTGEALSPGDFVTINLATFPTPNSTSGRGGVRVVQAMSPAYTPAGPEWEWVDAGGNDQPLSAPSLSLAKSTAYPLNWVVATVSNLSTEASGWQLQMGVGSTQPDWWGYRLLDDSTGDFDAGPFPSGNKVWGRIRARSDGRIRSAWSSPTSSTLSAITAPTSLQIVNDSGGVATYEWTLGSTSHRTDAMLAEESTSCTSTLGVVGTVPVGATQYTIEGLTIGSSNCAGVRHRDQYGGYSAITKTAFTASTSSPTAPGIARILVYAGALCSSAAGASTSTSTGLGAPSGFTITGVPNI